MALTGKLGVLVALLSVDASAQSWARLPDDTPLLDVRAGDRAYFHAAITIRPRVTTMGAQNGRAFPDRDAPHFDYSTFACGVTRAASVLLDRAVTVPAGHSIPLSEIRGDGGYGSATLRFEPNDLVSHVNCIQILNAAAVDGSRFRVRDLRAAFGGQVEILRLSSPSAPRGSGPENLEGYRERLRRFEGASRSSP